MCLLGAAGLAAVALWTRATASTSLCASCHEMDAAVETARESVHAEVACIDCHGDRGAAGALRYLPALAREVTAEALGWDVAGGVLPARPCADCHDPPAAGAPAAATGERARAHPGPRARCASCHGDVAHPGRPVRERDPEDHPHGYQQTHGRDVAARGQGSCADCHETQQFCRSCHVEDPTGHPPGWRTDHGEAVLAEGRTCTMCHSPREFCEACHGTEIPHRTGWLAQHPQVASALDQSLCATCHEPQACTRCHDQHGTHGRESPSPTGTG